MPFYRRLVAENPGVELIVAGDEELSVLASYLTAHRVQVDRLQTVVAPVPGVRGTPTLVLVDRRAKVLGAWTGRLSSTQEADVLSAIHEAVEGNSSQ
jgi:hypothetical protein